MPLLAFLRIDPALADGEQAGEARPAGAVLRPDQEGGAVHQVEPAAGDEANPGRLGGAKRVDEAADAVAVGDAERADSRAGRRRRTISSALETPRRKLKWVAAWSSV